MLQTSINGLCVFGTQATEGSNLVIYTNNLAGNDEIQGIDENDVNLLSEESYCLIPGTPLNKCRATTCPVTQRFHTEPSESHVRSEGRKVTIDILTADWFVGGPGLDQLALCAPCHEHREFKLAVYKNINLVILLT